MENIIQRFAVPSLTKAQQFLINLLCGIIFSIKLLIKLIISDENEVVITVKEYYERRSDKNVKTIQRLENENMSLLEQKIALKVEVSKLIQEKSLLLGKLRTTTNMLRIITKSKDEASNCKTPIKINVSDVDCLLQQKLNKSTAAAHGSKKIQAKCLPAKVVQKKESKKTAVAKVNETVPCAKNTVRRDTKEKAMSRLPLRMQSKILLKSPLPKKSVAFQGKGKENHVIESGTFRITGAKISGKPEPKTVINTRTVKRRVEQQTGELKIHKKLDQTFIIKC